MSAVQYWYSSLVLSLLIVVSTAAFSGAWRFNFYRSAVLLLDISDYKGENNSEDTRYRTILISSHFRSELQWKKHECEFYDVRRKIYGSLLKDRRSLGKGSSRRGHRRSPLSVRRNGISSFIRHRDPGSRLSPRCRGTPAISSGCIADRFIAFHGFSRDCMADTVRFTVCRSRYLPRIAISRFAPRADNWPASHLVPVLNLTTLRPGASRDHD